MSNTTNQQRIEALRQEITCMEHRTFLYTCAKTHSTYEGMKKRLKKLEALEANRK